MPPKPLKQVTPNTVLPTEHLHNPTGAEADRERQGRKLVRVMELMGFKEAFETPEKRAAIIDASAPEEFINIITNLNGILLNLPKSYRGFAQDEQVMQNGLEIIDALPSIEDKKPLLVELFNAAKQVNTLEDKAALLAIGINAIHPFMDANGRLSRLTYYLLTEGFDPDDPKIAVLLSDEGEELLTPEPTILLEPLSKSIGIEYGGFIKDDISHEANSPITIQGNQTKGFFLAHNTNPYLAQSERERMMIIFNDPNFNKTLIHIMRQQNPEAMSSFFQDRPDGTSVFNIDSFAGSIGKESLEYISNIHRQLRNMAISAILDVFIHPDKWKAYTHPSKGPMQLITMREMMLQVLTREVTFDNP